MPVPQPLEDKELEDFSLPWPPLTGEDRNGQPRHLYLIYPTQEDGSRQREYIGADLKARAAALARVEAHEKLVQVRAEIREVEHHSTGA